MRISDWSSDVCSSDRILGALFNGLFLVGMAIYVLWMGAMRLMEPIDLATTPMLRAAAGGIAKLGSASWRERGCQYVSISVAAASLDKNTTADSTNYITR